MDQVRTSEHTSMQTSLNSRSKSTSACFISIERLTLMNIGLGSSLEAARFTLTSSSRWSFCFSCNCLSSAWLLSPSASSPLKKEMLGNVDPEEEAGLGLHKNFLEKIIFLSSSLISISPAQFRMSRMASRVVGRILRIRLLPSRPSYVGRGTPLGLVMATSPSSVRSSKY